MEIKCTSANPYDFLNKTDPIYCEQYPNKSMVFKAFEPQQASEPSSGHFSETTFLVKRIPGLLLLCCCAEYPSNVIRALMPLIKDHNKVMIILRKIFSATCVCSWNFLLNFFFILRSNSKSKSLVSHNFLTKPFLYSELWKLPTSSD